MPNPLRVCAVCSNEFELLPAKPGFANRCPGCSFPKLLDPKKARDAERVRKRAVIQSAINAEIKNKKVAKDSANYLEADNCERRIVSLLKMKANLS